MITLIAVAILYARIILVRAAGNRDGGSKRCWGCEDDAEAEGNDMADFNEAFNRLIAHEGHRARLAHILALVVRVKPFKVV